MRYCEGKYTPSKALEYAHRWWDRANHNCKELYTSCTPWSYFGSGHCGYPSHGGDCANFVSQCLVEAGHPYLNQGSPCRGYPCGKEEVSAKNLGDCLAEKHHWRRTCGHRTKPPHDMRVGDVLVYHAVSCESYEAHATIITHVDSKDVRISCHSPGKFNVTYHEFAKDFEYYEWLRYEA